MTWLPAAGAVTGRRQWRAAVLRYATVALVCGYAGWRAWDTWPAVDRHDDRRADALVERVANGAGESSAVIVSGMDWQSENALLYSSRWERRNLAWLRVGEVLPQFPFFVRDNHEINRDVVLTTSAAAAVTATYGDLFSLEPIDPVEDGLLASVTKTIPRGAPYVLTLLKPTPETRFDAADYDAAVAQLTGERATPRTGRLYEVIAGVAGEKPSVQRGERRPFRQDIAIAGERFTVRMESWLPDDTFRRAGFGQVILGRERLLIIERGVSLAWLTPSGQPRVAYTAGLYATQPRFRISRARLQLAALPREP
jgi:hypothetical protein